MIVSIKKAIFLITGAIFTGMLNAQQFRLADPALFSNVFVDNKNNIFLKKTDNSIQYLKNNTPKYSLNNFHNCFTGNDKGLEFDIRDTNFNGTLYFGFYSKEKLPQIKYLSCKYEITKGKSFVNLKDSSLAGFIDRNTSMKSGYRITDSIGNKIYEGKINVVAERGFAVDYTVVGGPYIGCLTYNTATISFETNKKIIASITINTKTYRDEKEKCRHEFEIKDLKPDTMYIYKIQYGSGADTYSFKTPAMKGSGKPFVFAYVSDCREDVSSEEKNIWGTNAAMVRKIMKSAFDRNSAFIQFAGDLVEGYTNNADDFVFQLENFRHATEPYSHYIPLYTAMGNHESVCFYFNDNTRMPRFPIISESAEVNFAKVFVNPENGPISEDNSKMDVNKAEYDFPPYRENVYYYIYGNTAVIVLNSDYWYSPSKTSDELSADGNIHGYIMDNQLGWLKNMIYVFEKDTAVRNIFVTMHTPVFPNGNHLNDAMWYNGDNTFRPSVAGKNADKGIIERRDELLDIICNKSTKTIAVLTGDEHNYCRMIVDTNISMYPENYKWEKIKLKRQIWQINNGGGGAPLSGQSKTRWSSLVNKFAAANTLVFFYVDGKTVKMQAINPETNQVIDEAVLK